MSNKTTNKVEQLEEVLFTAFITQLELDPTAGWAQVARGLLQDYRANIDDMPSVQNENMKALLREAAPFKLNTGAQG